MTRNVTWAHVPFSRVTPVYSQRKGKAMEETLKIGTRARRTVGMRRNARGGSLMNAKTRSGHIGEGSTTDVKRRGQPGWDMF